MGSPASEVDRWPSEIQHQVTITKGFWMSDHEVTQSEYKSIIGQNPSYFSFGLPSDQDRPVETVNWSEAVKYCTELTDRERALGKITDQQVYRLPTEAEWEYAARAGTTGPRYGDLDPIAWYSGNSGDKTHSVRQKIPNNSGLYDMLGNVSEWCSDWYLDYSKDSLIDPTGPTDGTGKTFRGGQSNYGDMYCRAAARSQMRPGSAANFIGFRPVLSAVQIDPPKFDSHPQSVNTTSGFDVILTVSAKNYNFLQWFKDDTALLGVTNSTLSLTNVQPFMIGDYTAVVSNAAGSVTSSVASLSIKGVDSGIWKGLVAYYPFNGNADDASGNGNNGTLLRGTFISDRFGNSSKALQNSLPVPNWGWAVDTGITSQFSSSFTLSVWFKHTSPNDSILIAYGNSGVVDPYIAVVPDLIDYRLRVGKNLSLSDPRISDGNWHLMVATCKNGVASLYFDGNLVKKESDSTPTAYSGKSWKLAPGPCSLDDVRIYNRELSEAEVKALYDYESVLIEFLPESSGTASINQSVEATLPTGGTQRYYSQSNSPNGPFSDQSIIFNGHAGNNREMLDGSHLVYRMRIIFNSEVYLKLFTEVAIGDQSAPSFIRVLDSNKVEKIRQPINGFNIRVTNSVDRSQRLCFLY